MTETATTTRRTPVTITIDVTPLVDALERVLTRALARRSPAETEES